MNFPFETYQFNIPVDKTVIHTASRQELIFSATVCSQSPKTATISIWRKTGDTELPVEFQTKVPGFEVADNRAIELLGLKDIALKPGEVILASSSNQAPISSSTWEEVLNSTWEEVLNSPWEETLKGKSFGSDSSSDSGLPSSNELTLTISVLFPQ